MTPVHPRLSGADLGGLATRDESSASTSPQEQPRAQLAIEPDLRALPLFGRLLRAFRERDDGRVDDLRQRLDGLGWSITHQTETTDNVVNEPAEAAPRDKPAGSTERLATSVVRLALAGLEPVIEIDDWSVLLGCSRRAVERLRAAGKLPPPDLKVGRCPKWLPTTVRTWLEKQKRGGR